MRLITLREYLDFLHANGVRPPDDIEDGPYTPIQGYMPSKQLTWVLRFGQFRQPFGLVQTAGRLDDVVAEVRLNLGIVGDLPITWAKFSAPPPPPPSGADPVIGDPIPGLPGWFMNRGPQFLEGSIYDMPGTTRRFVLRGFGFNRQWEELK